MGDLEKMGRELKCPICLGLLHSAVSLTCNHLFCNSCIFKSMKSASSCPVCKIPFTRREVRPAPHIDNLVTIYKNMEAASGINLFGTQNPTATKSPGLFLLSKTNILDPSIRPVDAFCPLIPDTDQEHLMYFSCSVNVFEILTNEF